MAVVFTFYDSDGETPLSVLNLSSLRPGKTLEKKYLSGRESFGFMRNEIGSRLDSDMAAKLNELRQQKVKGEKQKKSAKP